MTILHFIPTPKHAKAQNFVSMLQSSMGKAVKMNVLSGKVKRKEFLKQLAIINPDIVHIHGCWQYNATQVQKWCNHRGYPVIISPHNLLSSEIIATNPWKYYIPRIIAYQFHSIRSCYLLLATSEKELTELKNLGWRKRLLLADASDPNLSETLYAIYKKVIDSKLRNHLSVSDTAALYTFLNAANYTAKQNAEPLASPLNMHEEEQLPYTQDDIDACQKLSANSWHAIQVYAIDHGIKDLLHKGLKALGITIPEVITTPPDRFPYHSKIKIKKGINKDNLTDRYPNNPFEIDIAMNIICLHGMLVHHRKPSDDTPSPLHLINDIHQQLRWHDYDEAVLMSILNSIGIKTFTTRLMYILQQACHLTIGYMPIDPVNDHTTKQLLIKLNDLS